MNTYHAALWSMPSDERRDRTTHHKKTKQRGQEEWTWEDILNGKGSWMWEDILAGRDRLPWEQTEAARREQFYKWSRLARKPERQLHKNILEGAHREIGGVRGES